MNHEGRVTVPADRDPVWNAITDPEVLTACVMGAEDISRVSDAEYEGVIRQGFAGVSVTMEGTVRIEDREPPDRMAFSGVGTDDRTNSRMEADADVVLVEADAGTALEYDVDVSFAGRLATLGARVLRRQIRTNVETYFNNLVEHVEEDR
ncbi:MAG: carbon monoxide dehydrogenase subunit G [Halobacteriales archaeon]